MSKYQKHDKVMDKYGKCPYLGNYLSHWVGRACWEAERLISYHVHLTFDWQHTTVDQLESLYWIEYKLWIHSTDFCSQSTERLSLWGLSVLVPHQTLPTLVTKFLENVVWRVHLLWRNGVHSGRSVQYEGSDLRTRHWQIYVSARDRYSIWISHKHQ